MIDDIENIIIRVLEGSKEYRDLEIFSEWYNSSEENKTHFLLLKDIYDRRKGGVYPNNYEINALWERIDEDVNRKLSVKRRNSIITIVSEVAAVAIVLIVLAVSFLSKNKEEVNWIEVRTTERSAPETIFLSDGSKIILNASSVIKYPETFTLDRREVYLDGEAYFSVVNNKNQDFIVYTEYQTVKVIGTEFNLLAYSGDLSTVTTLVEGKVKLELLDNSKSKLEEVVLNPNEQIYFDTQSFETLVYTTDVSDAMAWIDGVYSFREATLDQITRRIGKITGITFIISDENIRSEKYTGKFFYNQTQEEVIEVLNFKGQYNIEASNDTIFIFN